MVEDLSKRKKIIRLIIILLLLLIIAAIIYLLLTYFKAQPPAENINYNINQAPVVPETMPTPATFNQPKSVVLADIEAANKEAEETPSEQEKAELIFIAPAFVERFGTYSNQSDYSNLDELEGFMTDSMKNWLSRYKNELRTAHPNIDDYYAIQTKAITTKVQNVDQQANTSEVLVKTQRLEFAGDADNPREFYQEILLQLVKPDGEWKVQGAYWQ